MYANISSYKMQTRVIFGINNIEMFPVELAKFQPERILLIMNAQIKQTQFFTKLRGILEKNSYSYIVFNKVLPEPEVDTVMEAYRLLVKNDRNLNIAVGGGSTIDVAKVAGIIATNEERPQYYAGFNQFNNPPSP